MEREYTAHSTTQLGYEIQNQTTRTVPNVCAIPDIQAHTARTETDGNTGARSEGTEDLLETDFGRRLRNSSPQRQPCREREDSGCSALQNQCLPLRNGHYEFRALHHETHHSEEPSETRDRSTARRENLLSALRKPQHETICRHRRRASRRRPRATRHCARRARAEPVSSRTMYARTSPDSVLPETAPAEKDGRPRRSRRHEAKRKASGRTHCRTLSHHEAQPCRHRARCPPEGTARNRQHDQKTRQTSRADERDQQRQPSCLRSDRAGHSCTQQTPSRWRCDVQLSTRY